MNTHDIELPPLPKPPQHAGHRIFAYHQMRDYSRDAIEADRKRIKQELEKWYEEMAVEHQKTRDPYYEGKGDAFDIAIQIVEGRLKK